MSDVSNDVKVVHRDCPNCGRNNTATPTSRYSRPPWRLRNCASCGFVYVDAYPAYEHLAEEMDWDTTWAAEDNNRKKKAVYKLDALTRWRLKFGKPSPVDFIRRHISAGCVLDLGCGDGSREIAEFFKPYGIEISARSARKADSLFRQHGGYAINAPCTEGLEQFPPEFFDACSARSYLEHEAQPLAVLEGVFRVLKPGGVIAVKVPNYATLNRIIMGRNWCGFRFPDHLNYFTPKSLKSMGEKAGFTVNFRVLDRLPTDDNMWAVMEKPS
jgi:SAM-dependent methyltransferase